MKSEKEEDIYTQATSRMKQNTWRRVPEMSRGVGPAHKGLSLTTQIQSTSSLTNAGYNSLNTKYRR